MHSISINNLKTKIESKEFLNHSFTTNLKNENSISTGNLGLNSNFTNNSASGKNIVRTLTGYGYITNDMKDSLSTGGITSNIGGIMNGTNNITDSRNLTNNVNENIISNQIGNLETENNNNIRISKTSLTQDPIFKIKVTSKIENKEDFFKFLNKELNKIYYLTKVFTNLHTYKLETHYKSFELIFLKYLFFQTRKIKKGLIDTIDIETTLKIPSLLEYIKLPEYRSFEKEINFQFEKISILYSIQKKEFFKTNAVDSDLENDFIFNFKLFLLTMSNYIEEIKIDYLFTKHQKYLTFDASKYIIFLNELIDSVLIEELFNKFINENKSLDDQKYFQDIKLSPIDSLLKLVSQKIEFAKSKHNY